MKIARYAVLFLMITSLFATALIVSREPGISSSAFSPTFATPINLSNDAGNMTGNATEPDVVSVGSYVYAAWSEFSHGILFRASANYGATWYPPVNQTG